MADPLIASNGVHVEAEAGGRRWQPGTPTFENRIVRRISSAHFLRDYYGKCENLHGHNYRIEIVVRGSALNPADYLVDFTAFKRQVDGFLDATLDHQCLNVLPAFQEGAWNPSSENLARFIALNVVPLLGETPASLYSVTVWETEVQCATYYPDGP
ncbi:MAG: 6-carboxytetrahydropterin synthase [bacterium]